MKLVRRAAISAITRSAGSIDCFLLAEVYDERLSSSRPGPTPFRADPETLQSLLLEETEILFRFLHQVLEGDWYSVADF
jgi:hypothetical protein